MKYVTAAQCAADFDKYMERAAKFNEVIGIAGTEGNAVLVSEEEYDALMETVFIMRSEEARADIMGAAAESLEEAVAEEDVDWN